MQSVNDNYFILWLSKYKAISVHDIGTFSLMTQPANMSRMGRDFQPPVAKPVLSQTNPDALTLADILQSEFGLSPAEANDIALSYSSQILKAIDSESHYFMPGMGKLIRQNNSIVLEESKTNDVFGFGLPEFSAEIVAGKKHARTAPTITRRRKRPVFLFVVVFLLACVVASWFVFPDKVQPLADELIGLFSSEKGATESKTKENTDRVVPGSNDSLNENAQTTEADTLSDDSAVEPSDAANYFVIGGSFTNMTEAESLCAELKKKGFPAEIVESPDEGRIRVAYQKFSDKTEAVAYLNELRLTENKPDIWLYTHK